MSQGLVLDIDYIANSIQTYINQENFYDVIEEDFISKVLEKTNLNTHDLRKLISQGKSKYNTTRLYKLSRKCNVFINSFQDVINVLQIYNKFFKLKSSRSLIDFLEEYNAENQYDTNEISKLKNEIQNLQSKVSLMEKEVNEYKNDFAKIYELRSNSDFDTVYNFLKRLSNQGDKLKMSISCALGLSEKRNSNKLTPLLQAVKAGDFQLTKSLIEGGCDRDVVGKYGDNCLLFAAFKGSLEIVKYLIGIGFDKNWRNKEDGYNAIIFASQAGHLETVKYLKSIGCDINSKQNENMNCVYLASGTGRLETVKYLVSVGGNLNEKQVDGYSPLNIASREGHLEVVKYLIQCGCNRNDKTNYNDSSLHLASKNGHFEVVEYLVSIGVNLNEKNNDGKTALDCAKEKQNENENYRKIVDLLKRSGAK